MIRFKPDVRIGYFHERLADVLECVSVWSLQTQIDVEVNSIRDGARDRAVSTLHPFDLAMDLDTVGGRIQDLELLTDYLRRWLNPQYDVVLERDHVHVEWDARRGPLRKPASAGGGFT